MPGPLDPNKPITYQPPGQPQQPQQPQQPIGWGPGGYAMPQQPQPLTWPSTPISYPSPGNMPVYQPQYNPTVQQQVMPQNRAVQGLINANPYAMQVQAFRPSYVSLYPNMFAPQPNPLDNIRPRNMQDFRAADQASMDSFNKYFNNAAPAAGGGGYGYSSTPYYGGGGGGGGLPGWYADMLSWRI